jgi:hypothetical protein
VNRSRTALSILLYCCYSSKGFHNWIFLFRVLESVTDSVWIEFSVDPSWYSKLKSIRISRYIQRFLGGNCWFCFFEHKQSFNYNCRSERSFTIDDARIQSFDHRPLISHVRNGLKIVIPRTIS